MLLEEFKTHCLTLKADNLVQMYLIEKESYFFQKIVRDEEYEFKKNIAQVLDVHLRDIAIVGSGKLGFSLKPDSSVPGLYLFKEFDFDFKQSPENDKSDLDVAIVSSNLFDKEIKNLFDHTNFYAPINAWKDRKDLALYSLKGRLRVTLLPSGFPLTNEIKAVQEEYQMRYGRIVNVEVYKSWYYFEKYHQQNIKNIQVNLIL